jgi:hypothetical protein
VQERELKKRCDKFANKQEALRAFIGKRQSHAIRIETFYFDKSQPNLPDRHHHHHHHPREQQQHRHHHLRAPKHMSHTNSNNNNNKAISSLKKSLEFN